ncbi:MAG: histidinol-phosphate aminotransferase family protein [Oscillospiraceae bacterium]|nr:histidinol-phosphate aminotransferase family protein [Oscillospiraceae bacterium]
MYYINENIKDLYRVKFHDERDNILRLDMNENPQGLPVDFVERVKELITPQLIARYPEKDRLANMLAEHNDVSADNISITCGSDEAMRLIFQCFGESGKELLTVTPTFEMYDIYAQMFGMTHLVAEYNSDFTLDKARFLSQITEKTGIIVLLNPNSPIGECWSEEEATEIIEKASSVGAIVVVDEAYHYFCSNSFIGMMGKYDNLIILRTFSKLFSCAGLRIGYACASKDIIHYIENAESTFNVNNIAILFAEELLKRPEMIKELVDIEKSGREWLTNELKSKGYDVISKEGNYVLVKPNKASKDVVAMLKERGIWIRDYSRGILAGWIRVSTGSKECMQKFFDAFIDNDGCE